MENFMKIRRAEVQTDLTKLAVDFGSFANTSKNRTYVFNILNNK
jgi:hypothetical protein